MDKKKPKIWIDSMTPEEVIARAQRAKWRFRAIVRFVMQNIYWLADIEDEELGDNVQKNIVLLTRRREKKSLLSLKDKSILNKPAHERTDSEKIHLGRIIGGLKCFRRYPNHVKTALAGVTYYFYYGAGRTIMRQGHKSNNLYFIITGDVRISQEMFDPVLNQKVSHDVAIMGPGNMFGEVSLLHDIPRTATVTTNTHVELLCLMRKDFDGILKETVQQQWNDIEKAMTNFTYFENWNEILIRECCILAKMKLYFPGQTILGDGIGLADSVYFILKGKCRVLEHLLVTTQKKGNNLVYRLYNPPGGDSVDPKLTDRHSIKVDSKSTLSIKASPMPPIDNAAIKQPSTSAMGTSGPINLFAREAAHISSPELPPHVQTHFMQVCILNSKACFSIGENMAHRRVVAITATECLLIPRYWLMQRNTGNIWNRVKTFLNRHIPTTEQVFKVFVDQRKQLLYQKKMYNDLLAKTKISTNNSEGNVPYHIRINDHNNLR